MPARTTRQQARQRAIEVFMESLDRIIPADESAPLRGRLFRDSAQKAFDEAAKSLNVDWQTTLDGKQVQRWGEALGRGMAAERDRQTRALREGRYPQGPANAPQLLVIGMDGGRWQGRQKDPDTDSRWREDKVLTVSSYVPGDGRER